MAAIDPNVLLGLTVPDVAGAASRGFSLGQNIRQAPLLREQRQQGIAQGQQALEAGRLEQGRNEATAAFGLFGDTPITIENFADSVRLAENQGIVFDEGEKIATPQNIRAFNQVIQAGKQIAGTTGRRATPRAFEGDLLFKDEKGNIFSQQTFVDPNTQVSTARLTDISGRRAEPSGQLTPVSRTGETSAEKRAKDVEAKALAQQEITNIKNAGLAQGEEQKKLGIERAKISSGIRSGANTARRSRSNLLRVRRALEAVNTGRLAAGRNLIGGILPAVRDANAEEFQALATQFALDELSKQSGTKTDFDFQKAAETQARLGNTKESNRAIVNIALDRIDEIEDEERQLKAFTDKGGNAEDFQFSPVPIEFIELMRANKDNEQMRKDFKEKYGFLPTGI